MIHQFGSQKILGWPLVGAIFGLIVGLIFTPLTLLASPFPGEVLLRPQSGLFWLSQGFRLGTQGTGWLLEEKPVATPVDFQIVHGSLEGATYIHNKVPTARLRVEIEPLKAKATLESYTKRWVKDYYQYGFKILASKPLKLKGTPTVVYDLLSRSQDVQIRQIIQVREGRALIMTCSDGRQTFAQSLKDCNAMAANIDWKIQ